MKRFSSEDVAKRAGVSRTTVSFVLNNVPGKQIPEETRKRVLKVAAELSYVPDVHARRIARTSHRQVGVVVYHSGSILTDPYIFRLLEGLGPVFNRNRCRPVLIPLIHTSENFALYLENQELDGLLLTNLRREYLDLATLQAKKTPFVLIGDTSDKSVPQIDIDNRIAARVVVDHLLSLGHTKIAIIVHAPLSYNGAAERLEGYRSALEDAGVGEGTIEYADFTEESGYKATRDILAGSFKPTAIFAANDAIAYGVLRALADEGLKVPADISVAGFDDNYPSRFLSPSLTSLLVPANALGEKAAQMLVDLMDGNVLPKNRVILPTTLSIRESTAGPRSY